MIAALERAGAVVLATPVYRGSMTGTLKNLLDMIPVPARQSKVAARGDGGVRPPLPRRRTPPARRARLLRCARHPRRRLPERRRLRGRRPRRARRDAPRRAFAGVAATPPRSTASRSPRPTPLAARAIKPRPRPPTPDADRRYADRRNRPVDARRADPGRPALRGRGLAGRLRPRPGDRRPRALPGRPRGAARRAAVDQRCCSPPEARNRSR